MLPHGRMELYIEKLIRSFNNDGVALITILTATLLSVCFISFFGLIPRGLTALLLFFTDHPTLLAKRASDHSPNLIILTFFGAKKEAKKHPPPPRPPPIGGGCNRSSCRSYIKVSSDHQRSGLIFYGWRDSATLIIYTIELTPRGMPRGRGRVAT